MLTRQGNFTGVVMVYDEVSKRRRPTQAMTDALHNALRNMPRAEALEAATFFGIPTNNI